MQEQTRDPFSIEQVPATIAHKLGSYYALSLSITSCRTELIGAGLAVSAGQQWMSGLPVAVPRQAAAGEATEVVDAEAELPAVVVLRLAALIEILHPGDGIEGPRDVEIAAADIVCPGLDDLDQLVLDVPLDDLRSGVAVLLHLQGGVDRDGPVEREEFVYFRSQVNI